MGNGGRSKRHEDAIGNVAPGLDRKGFAAALRELGVRMLVHQRMIPDAFAFAHDVKALTLYEIEATRGITPRKFERIRSLRDQLNEIGWTVRLIHGGAISSLGCEVNIDKERPAEHELRSAARLLDRL